MKKSRFLIIVLVCMIFIVSACGGKKDSEDGENNSYEDEEKSQAEITKEKILETIDSGGINIHIEKMYVDTERSEIVTEFITTLPEGIKGEAQVYFRNTPVSKKSEVTLQDGINKVHNQIADSNNQGFFLEDENEFLLQIGIEDYGVLLNSFINSDNKVAMEKALSNEEKSRVTKEIETNYINKMKEHIKKMQEQYTMLNYLLKEPKLNDFNWQVNVSVVIVEITNLTDEGRGIYAPERFEEARALYIEAMDSYDANIQLLQEGLDESDLNKLNESVKYLFNAQDTASNVILQLQ